MITEKGLDNQRAADGAIDAGEGEGDVAAAVEEVDRHGAGHDRRLGRVG